MAILETKNLTVIRKQGPLPDVPFLLIKEKILGKKYDLTVVFCTPQESERWNSTYRGKEYPTNILSFPLSKKEGEIYICLSVVRKDAATFGMSYARFLHLLFIHGCLHLKGHGHGSTMETLEESNLHHFFRGT
jgi:rRNA maturation RNase YbeY